jgi:hypothetical protein
MGRWPGGRCFILPRHFSPETLEKCARDLYVNFYRQPPKTSKSRLATEAKAEFTFT